MAYSHYIAVARKMGRVGIATYANGGKAIVSDAIGMLRGSRCVGDLVSVRWL